MKDKTMRIARIFIMTICLSILCCFALSAQNRTISYQGILSDNLGEPKPDSIYTFTFRLYDTSSAGLSLWSETKDIPVSKGLFSTNLGDKNPFPLSMGFNKPYWLAIKIGNEIEMPQRIAMTSVGSSLHAIKAEEAIHSVRADTAKHSVTATNADTAQVAVRAEVASTALRADTAQVSMDHEIGQWSVNGSNIYYYGNVGIYNSNPQYGLDIGKSIRLNFRAPLMFDALNTKFYRIWTGSYVDHPDDKYLFLNSPNDNGITIDSVGRVGIGTLPTTATLEVKGRVKSDNLIINNQTMTKSLQVTGDPSWTTLCALCVNGKTFTQDLEVSGEMQMSSLKIAGGAGATEPILKVFGETSTYVLNITGGQDLAEPFEISDDKSLLPGTVVVIDKDNPGKLKQSTQPYDKRVAGIISGAGGIKPGLTLTQENDFKGGQHVALSGRVYTLASTENGTIEAGDLLTTSSIPGYAMKATDEHKSYGAIIGKAMSSLDDDKGLVLVLVNLQ
jgi:hypothetical protein